MRIGYLIGWPGGAATGPFKKIAAQTAVWADEGVTVGLFVLTTAEHLPEWAALPGVVQVDARAGGLKVALQKERMLAAALDWRPDLVYHRWSLAYPGLLRAVRKARIVLEVNSDDIAEYDLMMPAKARLNRATRGAVLRHAAGLAFVTQELRDAPSFARYRRPSVVVANGISLADVPLLPAPRNDRPRLLLIGQPNCPWHGVDKFAWLAAQKPEWDFDLVGPGREEVPGAPPNLTVHGVLHAPAYAALLAATDVGVGSLALHRKLMQEASPLKVREYLAAGVPAIIGYDDTDFPAPVPHLLSLPNVEANVRTALPAIERFVQSWRGRRVARAEITHLDHGAKERARLDFFRSLV